MRDHGKKMPVPVTNYVFPVRRDAPICQPGLVHAHPEWPPLGFDSSIVREIQKC